MRGNGGTVRAGRFRPAGNAPSSRHPAAMSGARFPWPAPGVAATVDGCPGAAPSEGGVRPRPGLTVNVDSWRA